MWTRLEHGAELDPAITPGEAARLPAGLHRAVDEVCSALQARATVEGG